MEKSISQTLAEIREKTSEPKEYVDAYNEAGFLKHPESMKEPIERPAYPDDSYERMQDRFTREDNFDPS